MSKFFKHIEYNSHLSANDQYITIVTCEKTLTGIEKITGDARDHFDSSTNWVPCPKETFDNALKIVFEEINTIKKLL